jgi:hypothetical protein
MSLVLAFLTGSPGLACESARTRACLGAYAGAQEAVKAVEAKSKSSVERSLAAVEGALTTCKGAERHGEVDQLVKVKNELVAQIGALDRRAARAGKKEPTAEELEELAKNGDPECPRGQAYRPEGGKEIRCVGPQLAEMTATEARRYFENLGYRVQRPTETRLEVEHGAERTTLVYPSIDPGARPLCVIAVPAPGIPWLEALTRVTGANPARVKSPSGKVRLSQGELAYAVDEKNTVVRIGECPAR